ncbi:RNAse (barnase) inhibitor barstar [Methanococcus maripaludis]|uniref:RNAse (Barnase) inhibitor barstar n=1 Tax=Methanococcus maripaludis TaxID=39152 RepID=A0A7J9S6R6_METMI|nr:barstar family protein [Methanococcus maripaludis]MBB6402497.1 RNAse (barnase) inhibitor barstar [Methanococcus maripaludis]
MNDAQHISFIFCDKSQLDEFIEKLIFKNSRSYVTKVNGSVCNNLDGLFSEFKQAFKFPNYFGYNWAAFDECLNDLDWIDTDAYFLIIADMDKVLPNDQINFERLLKYLSEAVNEWTKGRNYDGFPSEKVPFHIYVHALEENRTELTKKIKGTSFDKRL